MSIETNYLSSIKKLFTYYLSLGEKAMLQLDEAQLHQLPDEHSNSIALIVQHLHGNMLSRWTDFLTSDGEKTWRNREQEFEARPWTKEELLNLYAEGWACVFQALEPLQEKDLDKTVYIRNEGHSVLEAINRQLTHYAYHVGQIVYLAKWYRSNSWQSLSIPKGQSEAFNQEKFGEEKRRKHFI